MSGGLLGGLVGLAMGLIDYVVFGSVIRKLQADRAKAGAVRALDIARTVQLVAFPAAGYWIGTTLLAA